jgi:hypothetical protein
MAASVPSHRAKSALSSYDALRDKNLRFDMRPGTGTSGRITLPPTSVLPSRFTATAQSSGALEAQSRVCAQQERYAQMRSESWSVPPPLPSHVPKDDPTTVVRPDEVFVKARDKLVLLWDDLGIDDGVRGHFFATAFVEVSAESIAAMHSEIERLVLLRAREAELKSSVEVREGFLYVLQDLCERVVSQDRRHEQDGSVAEAVPPLPLEASTARQFRQLLTKLRKATFDVLRSLESWRTTLGYDAVYLWRGASYVMKMRLDCAFLAAHASIVQSLNLSVIDNPLLDPTKHRLSPKVPADAVNEAVAQVTAHSGLVPARAVQTATSTGYSPQQYAEARAILAKEQSIWAEFQRSSKVFEFQAADDGEVDSDVIQSVYDECFFRIPEEFSVGSRRKAARDMQDRMIVISRVVRIQRAVRKMLAIRYAAAVDRRRRAASKIQAHVRRLIARRVVAERRAASNAASKIQALARGVLVRHVQTRSRTLGNAALVVQCAYRQYRARVTVSMMRHLHKAATTIQALYRGATGRRRARELRTGAAADAACRVQKVWRGSSLRKSGRAAPRRIAAAVRIQTWYRGLVARRYARMLAAVDSAARTIQRTVRRRRARQPAL